MSGQAHMPRWRSASVVLAALAVLAAPAAGGADPAHQAGTLRAANLHIETRARSAVLGLYSLDSRLSSAQGRLGTLEAQTAILRRERTSLAAQFSVARRGAVVAQHRVAVRIRALYEQGGDVSTIEILLGAENLDAAVNGIDALERVRGQDEAVLEQLHASRVGLAAASARLATREARLALATRTARATATTLAQVRAARAAYIVGLAQRRNVNADAISSLEAQARAAQTRSRELARQAPESAAAAAPVSARAVTPPPDPSPSARGGRTLTVTTTGYALKGTTATGIPVGWGVAAVDPSVIPLGTHMTIPGYGEAVAADTGGAVVGATIDLWFPTIAQAQAWGRRTVTIVLGG